VEEPYLKKEDRREERWEAMALAGWVDPFGFRVISGVGGFFGLSCVGGR
jgi:hypothetical protein